MDGCTDGSANFATTHWSLVGALKAGDDRSHEILEEMARRYWMPVHAYLRRAGLGVDDANELAQGFFADVVIGRELFARADPELGKLRTLILTALDRYRIDDQRRNARRIDRSGPSRDAFNPAAGDTEDPLLIFEREWAAAQLAEAMRLTETHFVSEGRARHWQAFERYVILPSTSGVTRPSTAELATELGFRSAASLVSALQVVRARVLAMLRTVVAESVESSADLEREYRYVIGILGQ